MRVKELIKKLKKVNSDSTVMVGTIKDLEGRGEVDIIDVERFAGIDEQGKPIVLIITKEAAK